MSTQPDPAAKPDATHSNDPGIPPGMDDKKPKGRPGDDRLESETAPLKT